MTPSALAVIVPAHNEEHRIAACLRSLRAAAAHVAPMPAVVVVTADACTDDTATLAARGGAYVVKTRSHNVGVARAAAVDHALELLADAGPDVWLAMTDADTIVPAAWLAHQADWARRGYDAVLGTIRLAPTTGSALLVARHDADYFRTRRLSDGVWEHPHVHGANLGVSAEAYQRVGGFAPCPPVKTATSQSGCPRPATASHAPTSTPYTPQPACGDGPPAASQTSSPPCTLHPAAPIVTPHPYRWTP